MQPPCRQWLGGVVVLRGWLVTAEPSSARCCYPPDTYGKKKVELLIKAFPISAAFIFTSLP